MSHFSRDEPEKNPTSYVFYYRCVSSGSNCQTPNMYLMLRNSLWRPSSFVGTLFWKSFSLEGLKHDTWKVLRFPNMLQEISDGLSPCIMTHIQHLMRGRLWFLTFSAGVWPIKTTVYTAQWPRYRQEITFSRAPSDFSFSSGLCSS